MAIHLHGNELWPQWGGWVTAGGTGGSIAFIEASVGVQYIKCTGTYINYSTMPPTSRTASVTNSITVVAPTSDGAAGQPPGGTQAEASINQPITLTFPLSCSPGLANLNLQENIWRTLPDGTPWQSGWTNSSETMYIQGGTIYDVKQTLTDPQTWSQTPVGAFDSIYQQFRITPVDCCGNPTAPIYFTKRFFGRYKLADGNWQIKYIGDSPPL